MSFPIIVSNFVYICRTARFYILVAHFVARWPNMLQPQTSVMVEASGASTAAPPCQKARCVKDNLGTLWLVEELQALAADNLVVISLITHFDAVATSKAPMLYPTTHTQAFVDLRVFRIQHCFFKVKIPSYETGPRVENYSSMVSCDSDFITKSGRINPKWKYEFVLQRFPPLFGLHVK